MPKAKHINPTTSFLSLVITGVCAFLAMSDPAQGYSVTNETGNFALSSTIQVGTYPYAVTAADVNGDGYVDLISANDGSVSVFTNNGGGGFVLASSLSAQSPGSVAVFKNADGKVDLACANSDGNLNTGYTGSTLILFTNAGNGNFGSNATLSAGSGPVCVVAADVNGDGYVDLISANYGSSTLSVFTNNGSGGFVFASSPGVGGNPMSVIAADVNGDGKVDLIAVNYGSSTLSVLTNNGSGGFVLASSPSVGSAPLSVAVFTNVNGSVELACANYGSRASGNTLTVLTNAGNGVFGANSTLTVGTAPYCVVAADVNGDGKIDLISANYESAALSVLTNNGSGGFVLASSPAVGADPQSVVATDVTGKGYVDLITANSGDYPGDLSVLTNIVTVTYPPLLTSFSPTNGPEGTTVTINGANFTNVTSVTFNGVPAVFSTNSNSQINATVPDCAGSGPIVLNSAVGGASSSNSFIYTGGSITTSVLTQAALDSVLCIDTNVAFTASGTINLSSTLTIASDITLDGTGQNVTLSGSNSVGIFIVNPRVHLTLKNLTLANGMTNIGAGIFNNGGIVTITNCTFSNNMAIGASGTSAGASGVSVSGGGICNVNGGTLSITGSTFVNNSATGGNGSAGANGAGEYAAGQTGGYGGNATGGAIYNYTGSIFITNCTFYGNSAYGGTGATGGNGYNGYYEEYECGDYCCEEGFGCEEYCYDYCYETIYGGPGGQGGSGGNAYGGNFYNNAGNVISVNNTFAGGLVVSGNGGLGGVQGSYDDGTSTYGPGFNGGGAGGNIGYGSGSFLFLNTIVANPVQGGNFFGGSITDGGYNLSSDTTLAFTNSSSLTNTNPDLGPLTNNGGPTMTMALLLGSPAINAGNDAVALSTDQRGLPRNVCGSADIGAYELQDTLVLTVLGANPLTNQCFQVYTDPGATATDTCSGNITSQIVATSNVNTNLPGTYTVTYNINNGFGNSNSAVRTVVMLDTTPPVITVPSNITAQATSAAGAVVNFTTSATDPVSGPTATINSPVSGSTFPFGTNTVTVTATDPYGNSATNRFTVTVVDTNPPVITLLGGNPLTNYIDTVFIDPGATATDAIAGNLTSAIVVTGTVNTNVAGHYVLNYTVSDGYGNAASTNRTVVVQNPASPLLSIALSSVSGLGTNTINEVVISWPTPPPGFVLQQNSNPATTNWIANTNAILTANGTNSVTIPPPTGNLFFRLAYP